MSKEGLFIKYIRLYQYLFKKRLRLISKLLAFFHRLVFSCDIPPSCKLGLNIKFPHHGLGVIIHPRSSIGDNCNIYQHVTIGSRNGSNPPIIGNNVLIGA